MNRINIKDLAAFTAAVTLAFPATMSMADPEEDETSQSAPSGIMSPATPTIDSVDGTGQRSVSNPGTDSVDGTGLSSVSDPSVDSVDGTGLQSVSESAIESVDGTGLRSVATDGTDSVDGTGGSLSVPATDLAASGEQLLTVPASTRSGDCVAVGDAASVDSSDCPPPSDDTDSGE